MKPYQIIQLPQRLHRQGQIYFNQGRTWLQQNWFSIALVLLLVFVLLKKDVSMEFSMKAGADGHTPTSQATVPPPAQPVKAAQQTADLHTSKPKTAPAKTDKAMLGIAGLMKSTTKENSTSAVHTPPAPYTNGHFANTGFLLNPAYAQTHGVDKHIVNKNNAICKAYVRRFAPVAMAEMRKYGIPASVTLAQALLESDAGGSTLSKRSHNHFGLKCFSKACPQGHCTNHSDDTHKDFFRNFATPWESFRAHSILLTNDRYKHLLKLGQTNYKSWTAGLQKAGYATDPDYAVKLNRIIEEMGLEAYDGQDY